MGWEQFGYHIDTFEYCRHLRDRFDLTYLCADGGLPRKELRGVEIVYCGPPVAGRIEPRIVADAISLLRRRSFDVAFVQRTKFAFLLRMVCRSVPMVFDVRTGSVAGGASARAVENAWIRWNARRFRYVTAISEGLVRQLRLPERTRIIPLGANPTSACAAAVRDELRLIYVGTFNNRQLNRTIQGLGLYAARGELPFSYLLIGFGSAEERARLENAIRENRLSSEVEVRGRVDHDELPALMSCHNVGVAFTPLEPWFEHQPSTKVFEYLQSGLLCLATDSAANRETVNRSNGVLIKDTPEAFCAGLRAIETMLPGWRPRDVTATVQAGSWAHIVEGELIPLFEEILQAGGADS